MKICGIFHISNTDDRLFYNDVADAVNKLQADGQEVEIQYSTNILPSKQLVMNALILGRK